jgi:hypothetical protein
MQITRVAQSCRSDNQAEFVLGPYMCMKNQNNFIGNNISRLGMEYIRLATGLFTPVWGEATCISSEEPHQMQRNMLIG